MPMLMPRGMAVGSYYGGRFTACEQRIQTSAYSGLRVRFGPEAGFTNVHSLALRTRSLVHGIFWPYWLVLMTQ